MFYLRVHNLGTKITLHQHSIKNSPSIALKKSDEKAEAALSSSQNNCFESFGKVTSGSGSEFLIGLRLSKVSTRVASASAFSSASFKQNLENMQCSGRLFNSKASTLAS